MDVRLEIQFESPTDEDVASIRSVAMHLTKDPKSVQVAARADDPRWLVAEFMMPTEPQNSAVNKIDAQLRFWVDNRMDFVIMFPKSEKERVQARRKAERRNARRRAAREK
jgi:hypothetical protein